MADNGEIKTPEAIKKMKKALNKLKPHLMGESVDAMTIIVEGEKKKRDKSISKSTQPYGAKHGGFPKLKKRTGKRSWPSTMEEKRPHSSDEGKRASTIRGSQRRLEGRYKKGGIVDTTKFRYI